MLKTARKIVVTGISASGKSLFARKIAEKLNIPILSLDSIMWKHGWTRVSDDKVDEILEEYSNKVEWIIEGYKVTRGSVLEKADLIIYLDYSRIVTSWWYIKRCWKHRTNARPELPGSPDKFSFRFLKLIWDRKESFALNKRLFNIKDQKKIVTMPSPCETEIFLRNVY
ncbi:MAG: hypothetical protein WC797_01400 [Candidatus Paceibacterota bacterium]|jgi:adenylate kinase family enzyme